MIGLIKVFRQRELQETLRITKEFSDYVQNHGNSSQSQAWIMQSLFCTLKIGENVRKKKSAKIYQKTNDVIKKISVHF